MEEENIDKIGYKGALMVIFFSLLSTHLIAYSSIINMQLNLGLYEPAVVKKASCFGVMGKVLFLTCLGPIAPFMLEVLLKLKGLVQLPALICGFKSYEAAGAPFDNLIHFLFDVDQDQRAGIELQKGIV